MVMLVAVMLALVIMVVILKESNSSGFGDVGG
jgi:preprotein translocase subunit SecG